MDFARASYDMSYDIIQLDGASTEKKMVYAPKKEETWASKLDIDADATTGDRDWAHSLCGLSAGQCEESTVVDLSLG